jgi:N4-gp56 family major capsid protein
MTTPSVTTADSGLGAAGVQTVFDRMALFAFRAAAVHRQFAQIEHSLADPPMPGNPVRFTKIGALAVATSALSETADPTPVAMTETHVDVSLVEQGNTVQSTAKVRLTHFLDLPLAIPREVAANMEESLDIIARAIMVAGTNVYRGNAANSRAADANIVAGDVLTGNTIRLGVAKLRKRNTPTPDGGPAYAGIIHPDAAYDLYGETGQQAWSYPHGNVQGETDAVFFGEVGTFAGVRFVENGNASLRADVGSGSTVDVYDTMLIGYQGLGEAVGEAQHIVIGPVVDNLMRHRAVSWYALLGYGRVREESLQRMSHSSSLGVNT